MNNILFYSALMLLAGIGIPVMAALNSRLGVQLENPALATTILFSVGLLISALYLFKSGDVPSVIFNNDIPWYFYFGGLLVMFYILSITWVTPKFGVGNAVSFVLLGQLLAMVIIDHYGLFGAQQSTIDVKRMIGVLIMIIGVFLVVKRT